jgi:hypothetical protein
MTDEERVSAITTGVRTHEQALAEALRAAANTLDPRPCLRLEHVVRPGGDIPSALRSWAQALVPEGTRSDSARTLLTQAAEAIEAYRDHFRPTEENVQAQRIRRAIAVLQDAVTRTRWPINHIRQVLMILRGEAG